MDPGCVPPHVVVHLYWMPRNLGFRDPSHAHRSAAAAVDLDLTAGGRIRGPRVRDLLGFVGKTRRREEGRANGGRGAGGERWLSLVCDRPGVEREIRIYTGLQVGPVASEVYKMAGIGVFRSCNGTIAIS